MAIAEQTKLAKASIECRACYGECHQVCPACNGVGAPESTRVCSSCKNEPVDCKTCHGAGVETFEARLEVDWYARTDRVHQLQEWMLKQGDSAEEIVNASEKPWKWEAELVLALNGIDGEPLS